MDKAKRKRAAELTRRKQSIQAEKEIIEHFKIHRDAEPDGSFIRHWWNKGFLAGQRAEKNKHRQYAADMDWDTSS